MSLRHYDSRSSEESTLFCSKTVTLVITEDEMPIANLFVEVFATAWSAAAAASPSNRHLGSAACFLTHRGMRGPARGLPHPCTVAARIVPVAAGLNKPLWHANSPVQLPRSDRNWHSQPIVSPHASSLRHGNRRDSRNSFHPKLLRLLS